MMQGQIALQERVVECSRGPTATLTKRLYFNVERAVTKVEHTA